MIETPEQAHQAIEQMGRMQRILESYRNEILAKNPRNSASCKRRSMNTCDGWRERPHDFAVATAWRERMEDADWALVNSPEFMFVP
jgi:hypothetical protein